MAQYLKALPAEARESLTTLRGMIREAVPGARETMVSGLPAYLLGNRMIAALGANKRALTLYVGDHPLVVAYRDQLGTVDCGKGCIRFKHLDDLNLGAVEALLADLAG